MEENNKRIEVVEMRACDIKTGFGNPRKVTKKKLEELKRSFEEFGDFGLFLIDEENNVIGGNQRLKVVMEMDPETKVTCKKLIGFTKSELRAINIKDNTHAGDWDVDMLAEWTADLNMDLGFDEEIIEPQDRKIKEIEPIRYEKYNYVMIVCRSEIDYNDLVRKLGIEGAKVAMTKERKIKARAVWYDEMKAQIVEKQEDEQ